jgi:hypothetical protein
VAIIDYKKGGGFCWPAFFGHFTPPETVRKALEKAGYVFEKSLDLFENMSFQIFKTTPSPVRRPRLGKPR